MRKDTVTLCKGLVSDSSDLQSYATDGLRKIGGKPAEMCICENITDETGMLREGVALGMNGETDNARAECFSKVLTTKNLGMPILSQHWFLIHQSDLRKLRTQTLLRSDARPTPPSIGSRTVGFSYPPARSTCE